MSRVPPRTTIVTSGQVLGSLGLCATRTSPSSDLQCPGPVSYAQSPPLPTLVLFGRRPERARYLFSPNPRFAPDLIRSPRGAPGVPRRVPFAAGRSPVRSGGLRGRGVERGGLAVVPPGTGNRRGYWTSGVPSVPSEVRNGVFGGQLNSGRAPTRRQARSSSFSLPHLSPLLDPGSRRRRLAACPRLLRDRTTHLVAYTLANGFKVLN